VEKSRTALNLFPATYDPNTGYEKHIALSGGDTMLRKTMHSKLKAGLAATFAAGLIFAVTSAQAKGIRSDHNHPTSTQQSSEHHRHHHKTKVAGPVHGPGSSHNPIVTKGTGTTIVRDHRGGSGDPVTRDHRDGDPDVRDHRLPPHHHGGNVPDVRDHRDTPTGLPGSK
jgi:hypothetical protein